MPHQGHTFTVGWARNIKFIQLLLIAIFWEPIITWPLRLSAHIPKEYKRITVLIYTSKPVSGPFQVTIW